MYNGKLGVEADGRVKSKEFCLTVNGETFVRPSLRVLKSLRFVRESSGLKQTMSDAEEDSAQPEPVRNPGHPVGSGWGEVEEFDGVSLCDSSN